MKALIAVLFALVISSCATPVQRDDFEPGSKTFDYDYKYCEEYGKRMRARFGWSYIPQTQCMEIRGHKLIAPQAK